MGLVMGLIMIPSGNMLQFAIEAMAIEIVDLPIKHSYVSLPEGNYSFLL